ncbi:hypothetical protein FHX48_001076 [Microbacterium halimionae]|uniref:Lipoprotein n=1 Tax=Microbacterium halimionae TaxID=1526413 RepID=A0A7W3JNJ9_9MICO|nr:hypothetical protein [Microbacterium halimionae]MBA8816003.1 hypothetical protein [Microbacterium halimionae]NII96206.1 hypothetical protein [Microbacterium halimionae]
MNRRLPTKTIALLLAAALLTGCGAFSNDNRVDPELSLEQAKQTAMAMELELAEMIPDENVASVDQSQTGVLLSCDDKRGYQWTGGMNIVVQGDLDPAALVDAIIDRYSTQELYTAKSSPTPDGGPGAHVIGQHGAGYLVNQSPDRTAIEILSFSPCFVLPEGTSPRGNF